MKTGIELIADERQRQITVYGFTVDHDKQYSNELLVAANCYRDAAKMRVKNGPSVDPTAVPHGWPLPPQWWKPTPDDRVRELVKAGALFQADYDLYKNEYSLKWVNIVAGEIDRYISSSTGQ